MSALAVSPPATAQEQTFSFDIPAQPLSAALVAYSQQAGVTIVVRGDLTTGRRAPAVSGTLTADNALQRLLNGSGLEARRHEAGAITLVRGAAPRPRAQRQPTESADQNAAAIVVTGTLLRGVAPAGASTLSVSTDDITASGATSSNELLAQVPQASNYFVQVQTPGVNVSGAVNASALSINQYFQALSPTLRTLPTLVLVDGHRVAHAGTGAGVVDPDIVPLSIIERVEVVTDGGSAIYGTDAVGGVVNFITRRRFDGARVDARYGAGEDYESVDGSVTFGSGWRTGDAYVSYNYARHNELIGLDRDYVRAINWTTGIPTGRSCADANITIGSRIYQYPSPLTPGSFNACDTTDYQSIMPQETRQGAFAGLSQDFGASVRFDLRAFATERDYNTTGQPQTADVAITPANPFYVDVPGSAGAAQRVTFNYFPVQGSQSRRTNLRWWGMSPSLAIDLPDDWQLRTLVNYSESETRYRNDAVNTALQTQYAAGTTTSTAINPYDIAATPNQALIANILDYQDYGFGIHDLSNYRAVLDGPLLELPAGEMRVAIGAEYIEQNYSRRVGMTVRDGEAALPLMSAARDVNALFAELQIPIFGPANRVPGIESLELSLSARRDEYSDFGETTNPKIGVTYRPADWIQLRGAWGESFNAPPIDSVLSGGGWVQIVNTYNIPPPGAPAPPAGSYVIALRGTVPNLNPEEATTLSYGFDITPPFMDGLTVSASYYSIAFRGIIGVAPIFNAPQLYSYFPEFVTLSPTPQQILDFVSVVPNGAEQVAPYIEPGAPEVYQLLDYRRRNLSDETLKGIDFSIRYTRDMSFGAIEAGLVGNYPTERITSAADGTPDVAVDFEMAPRRLRLAAHVGATIGNFQSRITWRHNAGFDVTRSATLPQDEVDAFNPIDLFFRYNAEGEGLASDLALTLNVSNVFDSEPPEYRLAGSSGVNNGTTLGRIITLGLSKSF